MSERSPTYGLSDRTRKHVSIACNDLSRAINTLEAHHLEQQSAFQGAIAGVNTKLDGEAEDRARLIAEAVAQVEAQAVKLREARELLLERLLPLRTTSTQWRSRRRTSSGLLPVVALSVLDCSS